MAYQSVRISASLFAVTAAGLLSGCGERVASFDCARMSQQARETSQGQPYKINEITNVREVSRNEQEARCQGNAAWSDNSSSDIYLRAYIEGENIMVAYSDQGFDSATSTPPAAPQGAQPAPGGQGQ